MEFCLFYFNTLKNYNIYYYDNVLLTDIHFEHESYSFDETDGNVTVVVRRTTLVFEPAFDVQVYGGKQCAHFLFVQCTNSTLTTEVNVLVPTLQVPMLSHLDGRQWGHRVLKLVKPSLLQ